MYWVYCIENKINGKKYIGKATKPNRRWASHISNSKKKSIHQKYIHRAIAKYGLENFWFRCIDFELNEEKALEQERYWIQFFNTTNPKIGYNLTLGGEGKSGYKHTLKTKKMLSEIAKKRIGPANPFYGKRKTTPEQDREIIFLIDSGKNKEEIATMFGVSRRTISNIIKGIGRK